ncbi:MAG: hypothetical protein U0Z44_07670 [Kouleothrix sp.]
MCDETCPDATRGAAGRRAGAPSAYAQAPDAATRLVVQPSPAGSSPDPAIDIRLNTADGRPVADARVLVLVDGQRLGEARTDSAGAAGGRIDRPT